MANRPGKGASSAKKENKLVMMDFTGSDCVVGALNCTRSVLEIRLRRLRAKEPVLVEVDFPRLKKLSDEQQKANNALQGKYKIEGYPTIIVLDGEGKKVGQLGYMSTPKPFIDELEK